MTSANIFLLTIVSILLLFFSLFSGNFILKSDFVNIYTGVTLLQETKGNSLYDLNLQKAKQKVITKNAEIKFLPFRQSALIAFLLFPLSFLSLAEAYTVFAYLNIAVLLLFYVWAKQEFVNIQHSLLFCLVIFISLVSLHTIMTGQTTIIISLILLFLYISLREKKSFTVGCLASLLIFMKVQLLILIPFIYLLSKDRMKYLSGFILSSLILLAVCLQIIGLEGVRTYPNFLLATESAVFGSNLWDSFSLAAVLSKTGLNNPAIFWVNLFFYTIFLLFFCLNFSRRSLAQNFVTALLLTVLFSVHYLAHDLTLLNVVILILFDSYYRAKNSGKKILFNLAGLIYSLIFFLIVPVISGLKLNLAFLALLPMTLLLLTKKYEIK